MKKLIARGPDPAMTRTEFPVRLWDNFYDANFGGSYVLAHAPKNSVTFAGNDLMTTLIASNVSLPNN